MTSAGTKAAAAAAVLVAVALLWFAFAPSGGGSHPGPDAATSAAAGASGAATPNLASSRVALPATAPASPASEAAPPEAVPLGSNEVPDLRADAQGRLVVNAHTRNELEKLTALNDRLAALALLRRLEAVLPPIAYRQAVDALYAYQNYSIAASQFTASAQPVTDEASALQQLDALHALRVQQLGPEVAQAYFGDEEAAARRLIANMQAQPATGTLGERAEQAQRASNPLR